VGGHRHYPEIKQELALLAGESVGLTFVPHLVPMIRGMQATLYVDLLIHILNGLTRSTFNQIVNH
jgi:N-acetyl-gamma-glutamyl-phosphate reductase